ncbi:MAG: hypothetical protein JNK65_06675 [Deltaproteobacteria bacterium]|nr:hypothetical protein [Deltaproteobacteria bacterium]
MLLECKLSADPEPKSLIYYAERLKPEHTILLTHDWEEPRKKVYRNTSYWLSSAGAFFSEWV